MDLFGWCEGKSQLDERDLVHLMTTNYFVVVDPGTRNIEQVIQSKGDDTDLLKLNQEHLVP